MLTFLSFVFVLGVLIFFHELGHFVVAKRVGIQVDRFSIGFPPYIFSRKKGETIYSIGIIPLGGFVKMAGENPDDESSGSPREFMSKTVLQRTAVIFAGPFMNYVLAVLLLFGVYLFAGVPKTDPDHAMIGEVDEGSPAAEAGILPGDQIVAVNGTAVTGFESIRAIIGKQARLPVEVTWKRGDSELSASMVTMASPVQKENGDIDSVWVIGVKEKLILQSEGLWPAAKLAVNESNYLFVQTLIILKKFVTLEISTKALGGPFFIAVQSGREASRGAPFLFHFMALLSVNLAVLNVLPIPVLDGGHLLFLLVEKLKGSPLSMKARLVAQQIGMVALLVLIIRVTYNDILRFVLGN